MLENTLCKYFGNHTEDKIIEGIGYAVANATIRFSEPTSFNDPFEFKFRWNSEFSDATAREGFFGRNSSANEEDYQAWKEQYQSGNLSWAADQNTRWACLSEFGVACLSKNPLNTLMWSHYSVNHTGFCVLYKDDFVKAFEGTLGYGPVQYTDEIPLVDLVGDTAETAVEALRKITFFKQNAWSYEQEIRILHIRSEICPFPSEYIIGVVAGCRASPRVREEIRRIAKEKNIVAYQAIEEHKTYTLSMEEMKEGRIYMSSMF